MRFVRAARRRFGAILITQNAPMVARPGLAGRANGVVFLNEEGREVATAWHYRRATVKTDAPSCRYKRRENASRSSFSMPDDIRNYSNPID